MSELLLPQLFQSFESEAFRLETLPHYRIESNGEYAEFQRYLDGGLFPNAEINQDWYESLDAWKSEGKRIIRVRILPEIPNPYLKFEIEWFYPFNAKHGEEIFLLPEEEYRRQFELPLHDFWMFDHSKVGVLEYDSEGRFLRGAAPSISTESYLKVRRHILESAKPLAKFLLDCRCKG